ncbi:hypothetical protein EDB80DRAFT_379061 [Ilyonectria destructans]|nr:hypothetical protein EDB80DRAFT_379061 [Ilyonectria destructans]
MPPPQVFSAELITRLTCTEEVELGGMIQNQPFPEISAIRREFARSSLGLMDALPQEILFIILNLLDFQSLSRISRASIKGRLTVAAIPEYREIVQHIPEILAALGRTRVLKYHEVTLLRHVLRTSQCVSCFGFGAFLFLPTCERVCFQCLQHNHSLRMTTLSKAKKCFHLTDNHLDRVPILHSIPGTYKVEHENSHQLVLRLVSIKQVKQLAIEVHGSAAHVARLEPMPPREMSFEDHWDFKRFHQASLVPPGRDLSRLPKTVPIITDAYGGMASIRIPCLSGTELDYGKLCRGCEVIHHLHSQGQLPAPVWKWLVPRWVNTRYPLLALLTRLHSNEGFLNHIQDCYGVRQLLVKWEDPQEH